MDKINLELREITPDNWRKVNALKVKEEQKSFVADNTAILAKAFAYGNANSKVYAIYLEENPIGLIMQRDYMEEGKLKCILDQFMIDRNFQGLGYGKEAMKMWIDNIRNERIYDSIELCYIEEDYLAKKIYEKLGFIRIPEADDEDELVMRYNFKD